MSGCRCDSRPIRISGFSLSHISLSSGILVWSHFGNRPLQFHNIIPFKQVAGESAYEDSMRFGHRRGVFAEVEWLGFPPVVVVLGLEVVAFVAAGDDVLTDEDVVVLT